VLRHEYEKYLFRHKNTKVALSDHIIRKVSAWFTPKEKGVKTPITKEKKPVIGIEFIL